MPKIDQNGIKRREKNTKYQLNILFSVYVQSRPMKKFKKYLNQKINLNIFEILSKIYIFKIHFGIPPSGDFLKSSASEVFPAETPNPPFLVFLPFLPLGSFYPHHTRASLHSSLWNKFHIARVAGSLFGVPPILM